MQSEVKNYNAWGAFSTKIKRMRIFSAHIAKRKQPLPNELRERKSDLGSALGQFTRRFLLHLFPDAADSIRQLFFQTATVCV